MFKHQDLKKSGLELKSNFQLWVAVARHNFKWVKISIQEFSG